MRLEKLMDELQEEAIEHARQAMLIALDGDVVFKTGEARGFYKGLIHALGKIQEIAAREKANERVIEPNEFD